MGWFRLLRAPTFLYGGLSLFLFLWGAGSHSFFGALLAHGMGLFFWSLGEYLEHRFVGHGPRRRWDIKDHRYHHQIPDDVAEFVIPLSYTVVFFSACCGLLWLVSPHPSLAAATLSGLMVGYLLYEFVHLAAHVPGVSKRWPRLGAMGERHRSHHYGRWNTNFGFITGFWDRVFGTHEDF